MSKHYLKDKAVQFLKIIFPLILLVFAAIEIWKFAMDLDIQLLQHEISQIPVSKISRCPTYYHWGHFSDVFLRCHYHQNIGD